MNRHRVNNIQYTAQFGQRRVATIGLDDPSASTALRLQPLHVLLQSRCFCSGIGVTLTAP